MPAEHVCQPSSTIKNVVIREYTYQAVELDVLVVDQTGAVELGQGEALNVCIDRFANSIKSPLPDKLVAVDCQTDGINLWDCWCGEGVVDICCFVGFDNVAELLRC